jgi:hypothetical protein
MTDMVALMKARERMNMRKVLWFRCMDRIVKEPLGTERFRDFSQALQTIADAYADSCREVKEMQELELER